MNLQIPYTKEQLTWHLKSNVMAQLTDSTIEKIVQQCNLVNIGEMDLQDEIIPGNCTIEEMLIDLHIDFNE